MSQAEKKQKFIKAWYKSECEKFEFSERLKLANLWIEICLNDEEYEMASALKDAKKEQIRKHAKEKRKNRTLTQKIVVGIYLLKRRITAWIRNKRSR